MKWSPEQLVQLSCVDFTRVFCPDVLLIASMNGMYVGGMKNPFAYINKQKKLGLVPGDLDLRLHWLDPCGVKTAAQTGYIELKAGKNKPTDDQEKMMKRLDKVGIRNTWTNTFEGYFAILREWRVPMRGGFYPGIGYFEAQ